MSDDEYEKDIQTENDVEKKDLDFKNIHKSSTKKKPRAKKNKTRIIKNKDPLLDNKWILEEHIINGKPYYANLSRNKSYVYRLICDSNNLEICGYVSKHKISFYDIKLYPNFKRFKKIWKDLEDFIKLNKKICKN